MNKYFVLIVVLVAVIISFAISFELEYSQTTIIFGISAAMLAPFAIHKIPSSGDATSLLFILALYASFPFRMFFQIEGFAQISATIVFYAGALWIIGFGWKRSWKV